MGAVVVIGEAARVSGFALGGAAVVVAEDLEGVRLALGDLPADTSVVVLTSVAAAALGGAARHDDVLTVVMPL